MCWWPVPPSCSASPSWETRELQGGVPPQIHTQFSEFQECQLGSLAPQSLGVNNRWARAGCGGPGAPPPGSPRTSTPAPEEPPAWHPRSCLSPSPPQTQPPLQPSLGPPQAAVTQGPIPGGDRMCVQSAWEGGGRQGREVASARGSARARVRDSERHWGRRPGPNSRLAEALASLPRTPGPPPPCPLPTARVHHPPQEDSALTPGTQRGPTRPNQRP